MATRTVTMHLLKVSRPMEFWKNVCDTHSANEPDPISGNYCKVTKLSEHPQYAQGYFFGNSICSESSFIFNSEEGLLALQDTQEADSLERLLRIVADLAKQDASDFKPVIMINPPEGTPESVSFGCEFSADDTSSLGDIEELFTRLSVLFKEIGSVWTTAKTVAQPLYLKAVRKIMEFVTSRSTNIGGKASFGLDCEIGKTKIKLKVAAAIIIAGSMKDDDKLEFELPKTEDPDDDDDSQPPTATPSALLKMRIGPVEDSTAKDMLITHHQRVPERQSSDESRPRRGRRYGKRERVPRDEYDAEMERRNEWRANRQRAGRRGWVPRAEYDAEMERRNEWRSGSREHAARPEHSVRRHRKEPEFIRNSTIDLADIQIEPMIPLYITSTSILPDESSIEELMARKVGLDIH